MKCDRAKAKLLLISLPSFYFNPDENLRSKATYTYGNIARRIKMYVPARQKVGRRTIDNTVIRDTSIMLKNET